tara:strand:+ start:255 stop:509 length:255 start_codon:yes stop_codon:yes gene_type:complete
MRSLRRETNAQAVLFSAGWRNLMDEFTAYRKSAAITKFSAELERLCDEQSGKLYYAEIVGVLTTHALRFAIESIEEELSDLNDD